MSLGDFAAVAQAGVVAVSAAIALLSFRWSVRQKQTEMLYTLFEKFYEAERYKATRRILDNHSSVEFARLQSEVVGDADSSDYENFIDYLNFFEFLCNIVERKRLAKADIDRLFDYYLDNLSRHDFIVSLCQRDGFEALARELRRRSRKYER